ncbi:MAG TPA: hypothetical protein VFV50_16835, partial [Bdellovibrionales bacterium]|nr:hypothetical protein [Bdellovibrionales bacterium]
MNARLAAAVLAGFQLISAAATAADKYYVLSGGDTPAGNHYSQYLQTKALYDYLHELRGPHVRVSFGSGQRPDQNVTLADVHRSVTSPAGYRLSKTLPGIIANNEPATAANVKKYFDSGAMQSQQAGDTFFLLVSDHGMPNRNESGDKDKTYSDNCINLWAFDVLAGDEFKQRPFDERCLSRSELEKLLATKVRAKKTVFAMSQCYSGGFHQMSVKSSGGYPVANPAICGYTAVTPDTWASGCTPDADGPSYQGYERSLTEQITGIDF